MSHSAWRRRASSEVAIDAILDAAGRTFSSDGVSNATMIDIARAAGCSRATLYRYFPNREAVQLAFVNRAALRIASRLASEEEAARAAGAAPATAADRIVASLAALRADPLLIGWVEPENLAIPLQLSQDSELLQVMAAAMVDELNATPQSRRDAQLRGAWMLRSIVSLLAMPGPDEQTEREMIEEFIVPLAVPRPPRVRRQA